jgi:hypothetical protein
MLFLLNKRGSLLQEGLKNLAVELLMVRLNSRIKEVNFMDINEIKAIENKIKDVLNVYNFKEVIINDDIVYEYKKQYYKFTYVPDLKAFVIESSDNYNDAVMNVYEDSDIYPLALGSNNLIEQIIKDLEKYYL